MATYRNKTNQDQAIAGIGLVKAGETITTDQVIESSNFEEVTPQTPSSAPEKPSTTPSAIQGTEKREETK